MQGHNYNDRPLPCLPFALALMHAAMPLPHAANLSLTLAITLQVCCSSFPRALQRETKICFLMWPAVFPLPKALVRPAGVLLQLHLGSIF